MMLISNCREMALEIVQRSKAPNDAWRNLESHYRAKETREILYLSHEINRKTMQPGEDPFQIIMEIGRLASDLHRLDGRSVTELKKCVIIVAGLSADDGIEVRMHDENNPTGLERTEIERVVGNQCNRLLRQQQDSKALSASKGTTTADRGEKRRPRNRFEHNNCFNCGRKDHRAEDCRSAKKKIETSGDGAAGKKGGDRGKCYVCGSEEHFAHKHCGLCRSLEHRTRDCEDRRAEEDAILAEINVPTNSEVGLVAAMIGVARGDGKDEWDSNSGESFHMPHTQAGMIVYKKTPAGTTVEVADGTILPVDGFGTVEVDLDRRVLQPGQGRWLPSRMCQKFRGTCCPPVK